MVDNALYELAAVLGARLREQGLWLVTAESCTGGWIGEVLTAVPGSSAWFDRGFITYSNRAKTQLLGVPEAVLSSHGAVSAETVQAMVAGALDGAQADLAVAVSGIAGPDGGTPEKPVGTVWLAWQRKGLPAVANVHRFDGDRQAVRRAAVEAALRGLMELL
ncbi:nicotinamide-nucleotide amidase [Chitinivorax tropicus]|uniref:Nicotinamide-nucleotide amidase n=1 Tax=Chitinivorax tropicus TaxID=714531 RepID=A0A840MLB0_9PROT|nr:nicotinamide-nucleotide amidohydrolase family protein [Chitinivorax tropicus]MBB5019428.1 nicotinamide-nucleotide amidase [Chitinivorax tropicus]